MKARATTPAERTGEESGVGRHFAVIYARVSSKEQEREGYSIPQQLKLLRSYAASKGFEVLREFEDAESAKTTGRTAFAEMVRFLQANPQRM